MRTESVNDNHKRSIYRAIKFANDNARVVLTNTDLSAAAGMSSFHFCRKFKAITGITPHQFIMQQRINQSKTLLSASECSIAHIAVECGFSSQSHFSVAFKTRVGASPRIYRIQTKEL